MCQTTCSNSSTYVLLLTCTYSFLLTATYVLLLTYCFLLLPTYCYLHVHTVSYILLPTYCFLDIASYLLLPTDCYLLTASYVLRILHLPDRWFNQFGYFGGYCVHYNGSSMDTLNLHVLSRSLSLSLSLPLPFLPSLSLKPLSHYPPLPPSLSHTHTHTHPTPSFSPLPFPPLSSQYPPLSPTTFPFLSVPPTTSRTTYISISLSWLLWVINRVSSYLNAPTSPSTLHSYCCVFCPLDDNYHNY